MTNTTTRDPMTLLKDDLAMFEAKIAKNPALLNDGSVIKLLKSVAKKGMRVSSALSYLSRLPDFSEIVEVLRENDDVRRLVRSYVPQNLPAPVNLRKVGVVHSRMGTDENKVWNNDTLDSVKPF